MLNGYKTYIVALLVAVGAIASYFSNGNPELSVILLSIAAFSTTLRNAITNQ